MARRLLASGYDLTVFNRSIDKAKPFAAEGAKIAASPREAAAAASVIISMVADDHAARALWLGENGVLAGVSPGAICIECSTVTVNWVKELAALAAAKNCEFLDAPVTGSKTHAASGQLTFLVGGSVETLKKVRPILAAMSKTILSVGPTGSGALLKLINNFLCGVQVASLAEAMAMIERGGLDRAKALEFLTHAAPGSPMVQTISARMTAGDYSPNFLLRLMAKDLGYAKGEAGKLSLSLATAAAALEIFQKAIAAGQGDKDMAAIIEPFRKT